MRPQSGLSRDDMRTVFGALLAAVAAVLVSAGELPRGSYSKTCTLKPLGAGRDDTDQIEAAIAKCGHYGMTVFEPGQYNVTRKMTWDLVGSRVDMHGYLSFVPDIDYWLNASNTYRVVFIQNQASWFVVTGHDFVIDAHSSGGINGNGQPWWSHFHTVTREDGDGRPIAFTLKNVTRALVKDFRIESQPFWCNTVADSSEVVYDGMYCNATNQDPLYAGKNAVPNTDGINTYRSDKISLYNWDITCGDDCLAIKGNSTNIFAKHITCRGGNGIAFGSLGQYVDLPDIVDNVVLEDLKMIRLDPQVQPNMANGVYFKTWTGTVNSSPPTGGGGGGGHVSNVVTKGVSLDNVTVPVHVYQTNGGHSADAPSTLQFSNLSFIDWTGTSQRSTLVDIECSSGAPCPWMRFENFNVAPPVGTTATVKCVNVVSESGLPGCSTITTA
ncbi:pectin lyase-like protein [Lentinus tigrinus ALCF2SS1-7]|uniref:galacturonan 1,4-alpha-galacturonidase n=1 Tax=Lentinus tigrinus ALCF2SS1-6 TaxID=1328759 RepID=A0A5C2RUK0_9APHY|nr:pectin lyase-like protein [Lentinus tigrinus ALCF2SS1-6]RPD68817.1 pectin lyase-like protein [Lentinus tigrinus ALCF2SS1-7]